MKNSIVISVITTYKTMKKITITQKELKAIESLVDYLYSDEENHYEEEYGEYNEKNKKAHIFCDVKTAESIIKRYKK